MQAAKRGKQLIGYKIIKGVIPIFKKSQHKEVEACAMQYYLV